MIWRAFYLLGCYSAALGAVTWHSPFLRALGIVAAVGWGLMSARYNSEQRERTLAEHRAEVAP